MKITPASTIRHILRIRPLAVEILEKETGYECWNRLDESLAEFCDLTKAETGVLLERISRLEPVPMATVWNAKPIYFLIDHLTRNHQIFREKEIPAIAGMMETGGLQAYPNGYVIKLVIQEFNYFQQELLRHIIEEEGFLFLKIMRNEACYRYKELEPEVYKGSVNLYLKLETHNPENEFKRMIVSIREKLRNQVLHQPAADIVVKVQAALDSFAGRLFSHVDLEMDLLFPRAGRLEQELYESSVPGISRFPGDQ